MWRSLVLLVALCGMADAAYSAWHAVDDMSVICPVPAAPKPLPQGMPASGPGSWPKTKGYDLQIPITGGVTGMDVTLPHIVTFIRAGRVGEVSIKYEVVDAAGKQVLPVDTVKLAASGVVLSTAEKCKCTNDNGRVGVQPDLSKKFGGTLYGKTCGAWDAMKCKEFINSEGAACCKQWCYVPKECPSSFMGQVNYGAYWSYDACNFNGADTPTKASKTTVPPTCKYPTAAALAGPVDPCSCKNIDAEANWTAANKYLFGANYGATCKTWDEKNCNDPNVYNMPKYLSLLDTWCCEAWCYTSDKCKNAIPSLVSKGLYWTTVDCKDDPVKTSQCPFKAQVTTVTVAQPQCLCLGWTPAVLKPTYGRRRQAGHSSFPVDYGQSCKAHDKDKCDKFFLGSTKHDTWCCSSWCYVDEDCPTANPSSLSPGFFWSTKACLGVFDNQTTDGPALRDCKFPSSTGKCATEADPKCDKPCKADPGPGNKGLVNDTHAKTNILSKAAQYGEKCAPHDEAHCEEWWKTKPATWGNEADGQGARNWCCRSWSYVEESCPVAQEGMGGLAYSYATCTDQPSIASNARVYNETSKTCKACATFTSSGTCHPSACTWNATTTKCKVKANLFYGSGRRLLSPQRLRGTVGEEKDLGAGFASIGEEKTEDKKVAFQKDGARLNFNYNLLRGLVCSGKAYTNHHALGCDGWSFLTMDACQEKCTTSATAPHCPARTCGAAAFFPSSRAQGSAGRCHLYAASECKVLATSTASTLVKVEKSAVRPFTEDMLIHKSDSPKSDSRLLEEEQDEPERKLSESDKDEDEEDQEDEKGEGEEGDGEEEKKEQEGQVSRIDQAEDEDDDPLFQWPQTAEERKIAQERKLAPSRRRGGGYSSSSGSSRRRQPVASSRRRQPVSQPVAARRRQPSRVSDTSRRRQNSVSARRREAPAGSPSAASRRRQPVAASATNTAGRRRQPTSSGGAAASAAAGTGRRRQNPSVTGTNQARRRQPVADTRRRAVGIGGKAYSTRRRRKTGKSQPYGYTTNSALQNNYGGNSPQKVSYGYSGKAKKKGSKVTMVMVGVAGVAGGIVLGVGAYYAYQRYTDNRANYQYSPMMQRESWCRIPASRPNAGAMVQCSDCIRNYGSACQNQDSCFGGGGCATTLPQDTVRDDLMGTGFLPQDFTSPLTIKIFEITGVEFAVKDICPAKISATANMTAFIKASSFETNLFLTLTEMDKLGDPEPQCSRDTRSSCHTTTSCYSNEECIVPPADPNYGGNPVRKFCMCKAGYCYIGYKCKRAEGIANSTPFQAQFSWVPLAALLLLCLRAFRVF